MLRMNNLTYNGQMVLKDLKYIDLAERDVEKYTVVDGDVLFNRTNSPDLVGKTAVYRGADRLAFAGYLVRLRTNQLADPDYISMLLNSRYGKAVLRGMCKSIIGMANINAKELCGISIPVPPIGLQNSFSAVLANVATHRVAHQQSAKKLESLFASLQQRTFRGEL